MLDFNAFPHLAHKILQYSSWNTLLAIGATSKGMRAATASL
jgi:hypothetical protein